jgi:glycosyltransferase involved in cell wall biosynthesis
MRDLRLLVVSERYWPDGSGGELATHLIIDMLRKKFDITIVTGSEKPIKLPGVIYVYEPLFLRQEKFLLWLNTLRLIRTERFKKLLHESDIIYVPRIAYPIIPYAKKIGKKVTVHLHGYNLVSYTATILAPYEEHKHRITLDDIELVCMKGLKYCIRVFLMWWLPQFARKWVSQADKVLCVSKRHAEIIKDQISELRDKVEVIYNPLPPKLINNEPRKELDDIPTFLYVGGDSYVKGFHILLQVLNKLGRRGVKAKFMFTNAYSLQNLITLKKLSEKYKNLEIQVAGKVRYDELIELHKRAWALIFPSIWEEPLPYAVIEAAALGTIPIASKVGGVVELIGDTIVFKFLFTHNDVNELIEKLERLSMLSPGEVKDLGYKLRSKLLEKLYPSKLDRRFFDIFTV